MSDRADADDPPGSEHERARLRLLVEATPVPMVIVNEHGRIALVNAQARRLLGYDGSELIGRSVDDLVPERFRQGHAALRRGYLEEPTQRPTGAGRDLFALHKDGREIPVEIGLSPITIKGRSFALAAIVDLTERKVIEELRVANVGMRQRTLELERLNDELESFSYSVSHDLRAPVRAIIGYSRAVVDDYASHLDDEGRRLLSVVHEEASRMGMLIDDLLSFSRIGRQPMETAAVDIVALVHEACASETERLSEAAPHALIDVGTIPAAVGDRALLRQVWGNLISNALKYSGKRSDPHVRIWGESDGDRAVYHVADNGVGFDMKYAGKLFGVFQRLHGGDEFAGTGVGLAIVQRVVHRHGGTVWADAVLGSGATFSFTLPRGNLT